MDKPPDKMRLNKYIALAMGLSRRASDEIIERGEVKINGEIASVGQRVEANDSVTINDKPLSTKTKQLILLNKPVGYVCSRASQGTSPTIYKLLPKELSHLKTIGRLDKNSSGLILLTNDGDFAHKMTHPSFYKIKRYYVTLDSGLEPLHHQMINDFGINLPDGPSKLSLKRQYDDDNKHWIVEMSEGRNRQIRRTFAALGYNVKRLHRTNFGNYSIDDIKSGQHKFADIL